MRTILEETLAGPAPPHQSDPCELTAVVRLAFGRTDAAVGFKQDEVHVIGLDTASERAVCYRRARRWWTGARAGGSFTGANSGSATRWEMLVHTGVLVNHALGHYCLASCAATAAVSGAIRIWNYQINRHIRMTATIGGK